MHKKIPLNKIDPNPFRDMEHYPVIREKVDTLIANYRDTGFWGNVVGREVNGRVQFAYGHHRLVALHEHYGEKSRQPVGVIIQKLSDEQMLKLMIQENDEAFGSNAAVDIESVRAVVLAHAKKPIKQLVEVPKDTRKSYLRCAPSFKVGDVGRNPSHVYTAQTLAEFCGWLKPSGKPKSKVLTALDTLAAEESGLLTKEVLGPAAEKLSRDQQSVVTEEATRIEKSYQRDAARTKSPKTKKHLLKEGRRIAQTEAKKAAISMTHEKPQVRKSVREARAEMQQARSVDVPEIPTVERFVSTLCRNLDKVLSETDSRWERINTVAKYRDKIDEDVTRDLVVCLSRLIARTNRFVEILKGSNRKLLLKG